MVDMISKFADDKKIGGGVDNEEDIFKDLD